jgi:hypothetical protein
MKDIPPPPASPQSPRDKFALIVGRGPAPHPMDTFDRKAATVYNEDGTRNAEKSRAKFKAMFQPKPVGLERVNHMFCVALIWKDKVGLKRVADLIGRVYDWAVVRWRLDDYSYDFANAKTDLEMTRVRKSRRADFLIRYGYTLEESPSFRVRTLGERLERMMKVPEIIQPLFDTPEVKEQRRRDTLARLPDLERRLAATDRG